MPESLLARRLKLGKFLGIGLYVHWTFGLLVLYVAISRRDEGLAGIAFWIALLFGVFLCVTLHEYGHAMAARAFGIGTADITLLPIGGVARLHRMPRIPWQELVVAVAGPAVNVVIALILMAGFFVMLGGDVLNELTESLTFTETELATEGDVAPGNEATGAEPIEPAELTSPAPSVWSFALMMLIVNVMLVLFNMIPAFPMDGGRVFRSLMAMVFDYRKATWVASRVGLVCAVLLACFTLSVDPTNPIPLLIAVFIGYAGLSEAKHVELTESIRGRTVSDVMIRSSLAIPMDTPLAEIVRHWRGIASTSIPVVSMVGTVVGMLSLREVTTAVDQGVDPATPAGQLVDHDRSVGSARADEMLESVLMRFGGGQRQIPVVDETGSLLGILDLDTMLSRRALAYPGKPLVSDSQSISDGFDRFT